MLCIKFGLNTWGTLRLLILSYVVAFVTVLGNLYASSSSEYNDGYPPIPDTQCDFITIQISENGTTYFIHSYEQGLVAAMNVSDGSKLYYEFDGDG